MTGDALPVLEIGAPGPQRDNGLAAILAGTKTALTGLLQAYEHGGEPLPSAGDRFSVIDSNGQPAMIIEVTSVRVLPISEVDDDYAHAEGRGYASAAEWRADHEKLFRSEMFSELLGGVPDITDDTLVVTQHFRLIRKP